MMGVTMAERCVMQIPLPDGSELPLVVAEPESAVPRGGIVVIHEARGVTDAVWQWADGLALEGWLAVVPHLYHRDGAEEPLADDAAEQVPDHVGRLSVGSILTDVDGVFGWLAARGVTSDQMGVVGHGMGGTVALIVAAQRTVGAAVTVGGIGIVQPLSPALPALVEAAPQLCCPWLGIYCGDAVASQEEVHKLEHAAQSAPVATDLVHLPDGRCCFDTRQCATVEAWIRMLNWFDCHLR